ncbi:MAG TPA: T9SS type A sorting domain-containing protein [Burkholderiales bacterium]|nr:T9SS type A sorting domain-containing protein [Burkholderiales bacterium]
MHKSAVLLIAAALASGAAWAQQTSDAARHSGSTTAPGVITGSTGDGGIALQTDAARVDASVPAVSGGVSLNARDNLRAREQNANVKLVFALNTGNYVSDVHVKVTDSKGKLVIDDVSNGPWLLARLPAGSYTATATYNGHTVTQKFSAGKGMRTAQFRWPASVERDAVGAAASEAGGQILGTGPQELR